MQYEPTERDIVISDDLFLHEGIVPVYKGSVILDLDAQMQFIEKDWTDPEQQAELLARIEKSYGDASEHSDYDSPTIDAVAKHDGPEKHDDGDEEYGDKIEKAASEYRAARKALFGKDDQ